MDGPGKTSGASPGGGPFESALSLEKPAVASRLRTHEQAQTDAGPVRDAPRATVRKMITVIAAANAPADPSPEDRAVAAQTLTQAQAELIRRTYAEPDAVGAQRHKR